MNRAVLAAAHGTLVPRDELSSAWSAPVVPLAVAGLAAILFAQALVRLRRRGRSDLAGPGRALLFGAGLGLAVLALVSPLDPLGEDYLLSAHMLQHVLLGDAAPALVVAALRGPLVLFMLPPVALRPLARRVALRRLLHALLRPPVAFAVWVGVFGLWHVPALYDSAVAHAAVHDLEHLSFALAGALVWTALIDPTRRRQATVHARILLAVGLFLAGQVLADVLIFSLTPLYSAYADQPERIFGLAPLLDQQLAGVVMMVEQLLTAGTFAVWVLLPYRRRRAAELAQVRA